VTQRLYLGFGFDAAGAGEAEAGGADEGRPFDFEERVRVEQDGLRIEIDVRIRRGGAHDRGGHYRPKLAAPAPGPAQYEQWLRAQVASLGDALAALGGADPFGIAAAISAIEAAAGDLVALTSAHAGVLDRFDAMMTMRQKATGDRADILQMVLWHRDLCVRSAALAVLPGTAAMQHRLQDFIDAVEARTAQLADYGTLLAQLAPELHQAAAALSASARLDPLIGALSAAGSARTQQKAHRDMLLALQLAA
jgi:hypothetical protein